MISENKLIIPSTHHELFEVLNDQVVSVAFQRDRLLNAVLHYYLSNFILFMEVIDLEFVYLYVYHFFLQH